MKFMKRFLKIATMTISIFFVAVVSCLAAETVSQLDMKKLASIESISVVGDNASSELSIKLSTSAAYTSYKTASPLRLIIDFSQVTHGAISTPVVLNKGNFKAVNVTRFDTDAGVLTRVEIGLEKDGEAIIAAQPSDSSELRVSFPELSAAKKPVDTNVTPDKSPVVAENASELPSAGNTSFKSLTAITASNKQVVLAIDGMIPEYKTFRLNKPERFVIDLFNVKNGLSSRLIAINTAGIASARVGLYPDKVRVVFDSITGTFPEVTAKKSDKGVVINVEEVSRSEENVNTRLNEPLKNGSQIDKKPAEAKNVEVRSIQPDKQVVVEKQPSISKTASDVKQPSSNNVQNLTDNKNLKVSGFSEIEMIDFQVVENISRVSIRINGDVKVSPPVKSSGYTTLTIKNSILPKKLQRSLETRSFVSPVLRVTPLLIKSKKGTDTKIRIATRISTPFEFRQEGDMIYVEFKHPENMVTDKLVIEATTPKTKPDSQMKMPVKEDDVTSEISPVNELSGKTNDSSRSYRGRKVTLEFADAEVRKIFQLLAEVSNKNFVLGDEVSGAISLKLVNVPWDQALDIILDTKGLDKREDGNIILIKGKGRFKSQAEEDLDLQRTKAKSVELKTETFTVNYAQITDITAQFEKIKTPDRGQISSDTRTNKVIVKDTPQAISEMRKLLAQLDISERQVLIEARIVVASSDFAQKLGVQWGTHFRDASASFMRLNSVDSSFGGLVSAPPTSGFGSAAGMTTGMSFGTLASNVQLDMRLSALASMENAKVMASPRITTLNNQQAKIKQGAKTYIQSTDSNGKTTSIEANANLELTVTPHINQNGTVSLKVLAKDDSFGTPPPGATTVSINTREADSNMLLRNGETAVIGGIFREADSSSDTGVPYLMDIPFLGNLFKSRSVTKVRQELLIFITPRILTDI